MKVHKRISPAGTRPCYMTKDEWGSQTLCGYVRKKTTISNEKVTCFYCKNILKS